MTARISIAAALLMTSTLAAAAPHAISPDDIARIQTVGSPDVAPGGDWVAYVSAGTDIAADKGVSHIWMTSWDGSRTVQLTSRSKESESSPRFSPDGHSLAFISARGSAHDDDELWVLDRAGGEARRLPGITGSVVDFAWSPDSRTIALVLADPEPDEKANAAANAATPSPARPGSDAAPTGSAADGPTVTATSASAEKPPKPIVIDRFHFKQDIDGYLGVQRNRLWLYDIASGKARRLTTGNFDEGLPAWSPNGTQIAFTSDRSADPDRGYDSNLYRVAPAPAPAKPVRLTTFEGPDNSIELGSYPAWSPDGRSIAYIEGGPVKLIGYGTHHLAVVAAAGGAARVLTASLDRNVRDPLWSPDGRALSFLVEDDGIVRLASVAATGGGVVPRIGGFRVLSTPAAGPKGRIAVVVSTPSAPGEIFAVDGNKLRQLSHQNDAWLQTVTMNPVTATSFRSADGTEVHGFVTRPANAGAAPTPALLFNHGGPQAQFAAEFDLAWQILAGNGYTVVSSNPRGSTGRGQDYGKAIYAAWGSVDVADALAAVDDAVARKLAAPAKLGVVGWSYGGMLTNYIIASDTRFKAAVSGASISNILAGYGTDQYINDYETELGTPWQHPDAWMKVSYPFYHNDRIVTPTLFMVGNKDFNVPLLNSEQMYQALRSRNVPTQLVIYPGEFHGMKRPSFLKDRMERWLSWFDARVKTG